MVQYDWHGILFYTMHYTFELTITKECSTLRLQKDRETVQEVTWPESRDMGRKLFEAIDTLLKKEGLKPEEVGGFEIDSNMPEIYTSMRIAETVKRVYAFGVKVKTNIQE